MQSLFDSSHLRAQCWKILARAERGESQHFAVSHTALQSAVHRLAISLQPDIDRRAPPLLNCWFRLQGQFSDDLDHLARTLGSADELTQARSGLDLAIMTSIADPMGSDDPTFLAMVQDFIAGEFMAAERGAPMVDAGGLASWLDDEHEQPANKRGSITELKECLENHRNLFGEQAHFGGLVDALKHDSQDDGLRALDLFAKLGPVTLPLWPTPTRMGRLAAGDAWRAGDLLGQDALVSFQSPILRLIEAMVEPLSEAGLRVQALDELPVASTTQLLTALLQLELVQPRHSAVSRLEHPAGSDIVVEFRCLAIALVDRLCDHLTKELKCTTAHLPPQRTIVPLLAAADNSDNQLQFRVASPLF